MSYHTPCCEFCGAEKPAVAQFHDLTITDHSFVVTYKGETMRVQPGEGRILYQIVRRGKASKDSLAVCIDGEFRTDENIRQRVCHLRRKMRDAGIPYKIITLNGYGYCIVKPDEVAGPVVTGSPARSSNPMPVHISIDTEEYAEVL